MRTIEKSIAPWRSDGTIMTFIIARQALNGEMDCPELVKAVRPCFEDSSQTVTTRPAGRAAGAHRVV